MWVCRRDRRIRASYSRVIEWTDGGIPYCAPEIALLFKAKEPQPKDEGDFEALLPHLAPPRREWLAGSLETAHPGHPWIQRLRAPS
jgi:hypothetical protein